MTTFFDEAYNPGDGVRGGLRKMNTFVAGKLELTFTHPTLQHIIDTLFGWFEGYYCMREDLLETPTAVGTSTSQHRDKPQKQVFKLPTRLRSDKDPKVVEKAKKHEAHVEVASKFDNHQQMVRVFEKQLEDEQWPDNDKTPDQKVQSSLQS
ncbi:hypothetical protein GLOTRDRAFT_129452 [Gloeophyllum trabeum ATCC 11539]|uniref:Uncharacterized protein n=1 Tax=Gloeophyllum trabeum (strain ATCC 11539 / FP-39264 / Madison 617) TaxID=670483 RepID=S7RL98_GLOTA|nr:uncharacterized protein GLOTRDRAFT_129452 [Gloeophyllum trabeum ATCC 11539]EPQ55160.1 hypothetical protein GLOTRDRAFT_129452 [Gloeophyllum trabeum ATCC 11539]